MTPVVLDASAILAMLREEPGGDSVAAALAHAVVSAVNLQEVAKEIVRAGASPSQARAVLDELALDVRAHDADAAYEAAALYDATKRYGRGLGDRSCMALGLALGASVMTADREWARIEIEGLDLQHVR